MMKLMLIEVNFSISQLVSCEASLVFLVISFHGFFQNGLEMGLIQTVSNASFNVRQ